MKLLPIKMFNFELRTLVQFLSKYPMIPLKLILIFVIILILLFYISQTGSLKNRRHKYKINKAKQILFKFRDFNDEFRNAKIITYLRKIDPYVFEELLLEAFEIKGYKVKRNKSYSNDGGVDGLIFNAREERIFIQAKRYKSFVNRQHIHEFSRFILANDAVGGYFIHTGKTSKPILEQFRNSNIHIISGSKLVELISILKIN